LTYKSPLTFFLSDATVFDPEAQTEGNSSQAPPVGQRDLTIVTLLGGVNSVNENRPLP